MPPFATFNPRVRGAAASARGLQALALACVSTLILSLEANEARGQAAGGTGYATNEPMRPPRNAAPVWADEFERPGAPDPSRWAPDTSRNKLGWYNNELQYYSAARPENARVENGRLIL